MTQGISVPEPPCSPWLPPPAGDPLTPVCCLQCVAAFAVSAVASQWERTGKPFNPLLGETYELIR